MNAAQRIRIIRLIEKIDKNPEFSNKIGVKIFQNSQRKCKRKSR